jgi:hypothetical protein
MYRTLTCVDVYRLDWYLYLISNSALHFVLVNVIVRNVRDDENKNLLKSSC